MKDKQKVTLVAVYQNSVHELGHVEVSTSAPAGMFKDTMVDAMYEAVQSLEGPAHPDDLPETLRELLERRDG